MVGHVIRSICTNHVQLVTSHVKTCPIRKLFSGVSIPLESRSLHKSKLHSIQEQFIHYKWSYKDTNRIANQLSTFLCLTRLMSMNLWHLRKKNFSKLHGLFRKISQGQFFFQVIVVGIPLEIIHIIFFFWKSCIDCFRYFSMNFFQDLLQKFYKLLRNIPVIPQ